MDWGKIFLGGLEVIKAIAEAKTNSELVQATCERDLYKKEVDRLNTRLENIGRDKFSNGNKTFRGNKSGYKNSSNSQGGLKSPGWNVNTPGTSSKGSNVHGMHHSAFQKTSPSASGTFNGSGTNNWKSQGNTSGFNSSHGRGNPRNKGRGRGQGGINK